MTARTSAFSVVIAALGLAVSTGAAAEEAPRPCPGRADTPLCLLHDIAGEDSAIRGADEATRLVDRYTYDAVLSDGEKALLQMVIKAGDEQTAMVFPLKDQPPLEYGAPDRAAAETVRYFFSPPDVEKALFENDDQALVALIEFYGRDLSGLNGELNRRCAARLNDIFKLSHPKNGYQPYRDTIGGWYKRIKVLEPAQTSAGREMVFRCAEFHNSVVRGGVPTHLYEWVKP